MSHFDYVYNDFIVIDFGKNFIVTDSVSPFFRMIADKPFAFLSRILAVFEILFYLRSYYVKSLLVEFAQLLICFFG